MNKHNLSGIITALATPFVDGKLDKPSFKKLLKLQLDQQVDGFVINGTTGESPCLYPHEVQQLFEWTKQQTPNKPVILGVGGNCTQKTIESIKKFKALPVDALLSVVPYYNRPPQRGLIQHFTLVAENSPWPVIVYNVPSRTSQGLAQESIVHLSHHPNIIGIKEASGDLKLGKGIIQLVASDFIILSGDDYTGLELCALGACGIISVMSHVLGKQMKNVLKNIKAPLLNNENVDKKNANKNSLLSQQSKKALQPFMNQYKDFLDCVYCESNPIGIKMALKLMGVFKSAELRKPLMMMGKEHSEKLKKSMQTLNLL